MGESSSTLDEVILEVEGSQLRCNKKELALHSDYFKIMFEGNFIERHQKVIKLEVRSDDSVIIFTFFIQ